MENRATNLFRSFGPPAAGFFLAALLLGACQAAAPDLPANAKLARAFAPPGDIPMDPRLVPEDGGWRMPATGAERVLLFEVPGTLLCSDCEIFYRARLKSQGLSNHAFLEMIAKLGFDHDFFHRDFIHTVSGTQGWTLSQVSAFVAAGPKARGLILVLFPQGTGTLWIKDVEIYLAPTTDL